MSKPFKLRGKWWIRFTDEAGLRKKRSFDAFVDAAHALTAEKAKVREIKIGLRSPTPPRKTFDELADYWIQMRASQKRSGHHDESIIRAHLRPAFGPLELKDIGVAQTDKYRCDRGHLDKKTIANHLTLLITMLNLAQDQGWLLRVPKIKKPKSKLFSKDYRYLRSAEEADRLLRAAFDEGELVGTLYATAFFTGMRQGELAGLLWEKINFATRLITVDKSFDGPTKSDGPRYVPVVDALLPLLRAWRLKCPGKIVFPSQRGTMIGPSARIFQETLHRILEVAGFPTIEIKGKERRYLVFHDLRHSFASHWVMNGGDLYRLQRVLGHESNLMTQRYAHLAPSAFEGDHGRFPSLDLSPRRLLTLPVAESFPVTHVPGAAGDDQSTHCDDAPCAP